MFEATVSQGENNAPRRVLFLESAAGMGGVQFSTLYLAQSLNRAEWTPIVVCPEEGDLPRVCREAGIETHVFAQPPLWSTSIRIGHQTRVPNLFAWGWNGWLMSSAARKLKRFLASLRPDLVVTKGLSAHLVGGLASRSMQVPCIWHVQDLISERSFGIYRRIFGVAARRLPKWMVADGAAIERQLPASLRSRISVVHNGVDCNVFRPGIDGSSVRDELGIPQNHLVIGHAGRVTPWKGQHFLIEAFARFAKSHPNVSLLFAGSPVFDNDSYQNKLHRLAAESGFQDRIKFAGYRHDLPNVLAAMDVFAFTSIEKDTSPLALLSAMSSGLPIVAFDIDGVRELIDNDDQLLRVSLAQVDALAQSLETLVSDEPARRQLGRSARELAEKKFSLEKYVSRFESVLRAVQTVSSDSTVEELKRMATENVRQTSVRHRNATS